MKEFLYLYGHIPLDLPRYIMHCIVTLRSAQATQMVRSSGINIVSATGNPQLERHVMSTRWLARESLSMLC